jgi:hypothetical protein
MTISSERWHYDKDLVTVKRIAIARYAGGIAAPSPTDAHLTVRDPVDEGEPHTQEDALFIGMLRSSPAALM